jgi:hypothetical protein
LARSRQQFSSGRNGFAFRRIKFRHKALFETDKTRVLLRNAMPFIVEPQSGEEVYLLKEFRGSHDHVFAMAVSNQAIYLSQQKLVLKRDPWYFKRVALSEVREVRLVKQRPVYIILLSLAMIGFGTVLSFLMMWRALNPMPGVPYTVSGWPIAIAVGGMIIPFIAIGRKTLVVKMSKGKYKWKPQLALDKKTRELCSNIQDEVLQACKKAGIYTADLK